MMAFRFSTAKVVQQQTKGKDGVKTTVGYGLLAFCNPSERLGTNSKPSGTKAALSFNNRALKVFWMKVLQMKLSIASRSLCLFRLTTSKAPKIVFSPTQSVHLPTHAISEKPKDTPHLSCYCIFLNN